MKRGCACASRWIEDAPLSHVRVREQHREETRQHRYTDISHLDFSERFYVTCNTYEHLQ